MTDKFLYRISVILLIVMSIAVIAGSLYAGKISSSDSGELSGYINELLEGFSGKQNGIAGNTFFRWTAIWGIIGIAGCFMPGCVIDIAVIVRRGFLIGYLLGCFYKIYAFKGIFMCLAMLPEMMIGIPALVVFSSFSLKMSVLRHENKKKLWKKYFLICVIFFAIFSAVSLFQSYLTTIFMKAFYKFVV